MQRVAKELHVRSFEDLSVLVALYRPSGFLQKYIDARNGKITPHYPCEAVESIAGNTFGVLVYQEQIMQISMKMAGYDLGQADGLRKVIGRKEFTKIKAAVEDFVNGCVANGYSKEVALEVAEQIEAAGRYCFNRSHAVSYARLSYKTAFLKAHFPKEYMCALLNSRSDQQKLLPYIEEAKRLGIKLLPPDYSVGNREWIVEHDGIRVGLCYIKGVGNNLVTGETDWDGVIRAHNKGVCESLIKAGALDYLGKSRGWMIANLQSSMDIMNRQYKCNERIAFYREQLAVATEQKEINKANRMIEQWQAKLEDINFQEAAAKNYDKIAGEIAVMSFSFNELPKVLTGTATKVFEFPDKNGNLMAKVTFNTTYGVFDGIIFSSVWKKKKYHDRYRGWVAGITITQGLNYDLMRNSKGVILDAKLKK